MNILTKIVLLTGFGYLPLLCIARTIVPLSTPFEAFVAGQNVTFVCSGLGMLELEFRGNKYFGNQSVSLNVTVEPVHNYMMALCKDQAKNITRRTILIVYFPPDIRNDLTYDVTIGEQATVVIQFKSNPIARNLEIRNQKNFRVRPSCRFYDGFNQVIVIHFLKVREQDIANYSLSLRQSESNIIPITNYNPETFNTSFQLLAASNQTYTAINNTLSEFQNVNVLMLVIILPAILFLLFLMITIFVICFYRNKISQVQTKHLQSKNNEYKAQLKTAVNLNINLPRNSDAPSYDRRSEAGSIDSFEDCNFDEDYENTKSDQPEIFGTAEDVEKHFNCFNQILQSSINGSHNQTESVDFSLPFKRQKSASHIELVQNENCYKYDDN